MAEDKKDTSKSKIPLFVSIALVGGLVATYFLVPDVKEFFTNAWDVLTSEDEQRIKNWVDGFGWMGPFVIIIAMIAQMFLIVIPTILLMVVAVLAYGPVWGTVIILSAVFSASTVGYIIGRYLGEVAVLKLLGEKNEKKIEEFIEDFGFWAVIVTRLNPFLSNDAISFVAGVLQMNYWRFIGATMAGILPLTIFIAVLGRNIDKLKTGLLWGSLVCLAIFGVYVWYKKRKDKKGEE